MVRRLFFVFSPTLHQIETPDNDISYPVFTKPLLCLSRNSVVATDP